MLRAPFNPRDIDVFRPVPNFMYACAVLVAWHERGGGPPTTGGDMADDAKHLARTYVQTIWNEGRIDQLDDLVSPGFVDHQSTYPFVARGVEGLRRVLLFFRGAFPDVTWTIEDLITEDMKVVVRFTARGTHRGSVLGLPGTGKRMTVTGVTVLSFQNGLLTESWTQWDTLSLLHQLGVADPVELVPVLLQVT